MWSTSSILVIGSPPVIFLWLPSNECYNMAAEHFRKKNNMMSEAGFIQDFLVEKQVHFMPKKSWLIYEFGAWLTEI